MVQGVGDHDLGALRPGGSRGAVRQPPRAPRVDLDGGQRTGQPLQRQGQRAVTGPDLDDGTACVRDDFDDIGDDAPIGQEVLAEFVPAVMWGGHGSPRSQGQVQVPRRSVCEVDPPLDGAGPQVGRHRDR
ncbi:hypothetical protein AFA91_30710 [Mycolicibacterium goodii]|uniref:Uncharacterized protein n=1 Tax=Mycolicibacterium goodii TaxID=134601 RepID=A0A0K0XDV0_MYCGD|nr:hypothetical protein AFA91_30710 [Mycolicibacterium goodii]